MTIKIILPMIISSLIGLYGCTNKAASDPNKEIGIEIYQIKTEYPDLSQENLPECLYCLDLTEEDLFDSPILTESDIETFDWDKQKTWA